MAGQVDLRVEGLAKHFGGVRVFADVSFSLGHGGLMGVIGPNGAGKTTLINVISGRLPPSDGRVLLDGTRRQRPAGARAEPARRGAYVPADQHFS